MEGYTTGVAMRVSALCGDMFVRGAKCQPDDVAAAEYETTTTTEGIG